MLAVGAFYLAAYHFAHGTFQPTAAGSARGCSELDSLLGGGGPVDLNAALDVCFDAQFSCSHAEVQRLRRRRPKPSQTLTLSLTPTPNTLILTLTLSPTPSLTLTLSLSPGG